MRSSCARDSVRRRLRRRGRIRSGGARSSSVRLTFIAPTFSSRYLRRLVPGIGTMSSPCARTQASASCAGVQSFLVGDVFDAGDQIADSSGSFRPESAASCGGSRRRRDLRSVLKLAGEEAAAERAVGDEADAEFAAGGEDFVFRIARPERVFGLQRGDGMNFARRGGAFAGAASESRDSELCLPSPVRPWRRRFLRSGVSGSTRCW